VNSLRKLENGKAPAIIRNVTPAELRTLLLQDIDRKSISGAHWFIDARKWYRMNFAFNNPLNLGSIHSELLLIEKYQQDFLSFLDRRQLVFFGVGTGDTEMIFVNICLSNWDYAEIVAIDVNEQFITDFAHSIRAKMKEDLRDVVLYLGIKTLFEKMALKSLPKTSAQSEARTFICLGNTIGNFASPSELVSIFTRCANKGDSLVLSYQTNHTHNLQSLLAKYKTNRLLHDMIISSVRLCKKQKLQWSLDDQQYYSIVNAYCEEINVFRSLKFWRPGLHSILGEYGWNSIPNVQFTDKHNNMAMDVFLFSRVGND